jgi:hypothetical protein
VSSECTDKRREQRARVVFLMMLFSKTRKYPLLADVLAWPLALGFMAWGRWRARR